MKSAKDTLVKLTNGLAKFRHFPQSQCILVSNVNLYHYVTLRLNIIFHHMFRRNPSITAYFNTIIPKAQASIRSVIIEEY